MPLKHTARGFIASECAVSSLAGASNTIVHRPEGWIGFNTDVWGAQQALTHNLEAQSDSVVLLGAGATARSMLVALTGLGVRSFTVLVRDISRVEGLLATASQLGIEPVIETIGTSVTADLLVNTLPGTVLVDDDAIDAIDAGALFDVVYDPWPTQLASEWAARGLPVVSGKWMLVWQALRQARLFYGGDVDEELPDEAIILTSMRASVGL
jgi:shikimate dehydrogenase